LVECGHCYLQFFLPLSMAGSPALYTKLEPFEWYHLKEDGSASREVLWRVRTIR
jgi:hypothetical protein